MPSKPHRKRITVHSDRIQNTKIENTRESRNVRTEGEWPPGRDIPPLDRDYFDENVVVPPPTELVTRLLQSLDTPFRTGDPQSLDALELWKLHGLMSPICVDLIDLWVSKLGATCLSNAVLVYNGHALIDKFPLVPTLQALGSTDMNMRFSPNSGSLETQVILRALNLKNESDDNGERVDDDLKWEGSLYAAEAMQRFLKGVLNTRTIVNADVTDFLTTFGQRQQHHDRHLIQSLTSTLEAAAKTGKKVVVDKAAFIADYLKTHPTDRLWDFVDSGTIRFLAHNSDDLQGLEQLKDRAIVINLNASRFKQLEARIIGEQQALLAVHAIRKENGGKLEDARFYVSGYGLIGKSIALALTRLGISPQNVTIIDPDLSKREEAQREKFLVLEKPIEQDNRPDRAMLIVATPGVPGIDSANVHYFAKRTIAQAATSGKKGVDLASFQRLDPRFRTLTRNPDVPSDRRDIGHGHQRKKNIDEGWWQSESTSFTRPWGHDTSMRQDFSRMGGPVTSTFEYSLMELRDLDFTIEDQSGQVMSLRVLAEGSCYNLQFDVWRDRFAVTYAMVVAGTSEAMQHDKPGVYAVSEALENDFLELYQKHGLYDPYPLNPMDGNPDDNQSYVDDFEQLLLMRTKN